MNIYLFKNMAKPTQIVYGNLAISVKFWSNRGN